MVERGKRNVNIKTNTKRAILLIAIAVAGIALFVFWDSKEKPFPVAALDMVSKPTIIIGGDTIFVTIADTQALREQGLSGHPGLRQNEGMLFIFEQSGQYPFWMKDMLFPLDIIWISADWKIAHIEANLSPETYPEAFFPKALAQYVLEVPAGFSTQHNLSVGMPILFNQ